MPAYSVTTLSSLSEYSFLQTSSFGAFVERRLRRATWLMLQGQGTYQVSNDDQNPDLKTESSVWGVSLGVRRIFNPGGAIEVSGFLSGNVGHGHGSSRTEQVGYYDGAVFDRTVVQTTNGQWAWGASIGFTLERELLDRLALRFSSSFARVTYMESTSTESRSSTKFTNDPLPDQKKHGVDVGVRFQPAIELRYYL